MVEQTATDTQIETLKKQIDDSDAKRIAAEKMAAEASAKVEAEVARRVASDEAAIRNGIAAAAAAGDAAEVRYAEALEKGDHAAAAKAQREMNQADITKTQYEGKLSNLEAWKKRETARLAAGETQRQQPQRLEYSRETQAWLDRHKIDGQPRADGSYSPEFVKAYAIHMAATTGKGLRADTPEYFEYMDRELGFVQDDGGATIETPYSSAADVTEVDLTNDGRIVVRDPPPHQQQQRAAPALSPSRQVPPVNGGQRTVGGKVRLTPGEVEAARISNPTLWNAPPDENGVSGRDRALREYAANKAALQAEGLL
jgi:hypothetical protein